MIEQKTSIGETVMTVSFERDKGGPGIQAGWGEGTCVEIKCAPFVTYVLFDVDVDKPVKDWRINEAQCCYEQEPNERGSRTLIVMADEIVYYSLAPRPLESLPLVCKAVARCWVQVKAIEALQDAKERVWGPEEEISDLERAVTEGALLVRSTGWKERFEGETITERLGSLRAELEVAKAHRDHYQAEYNETYGEEVTA